MSGHSKFANIKHRKGRQDAKRGKIFTKLGKEITISAKTGGGDISFNPRLRLAVEKAKAENMPKDNIERAIKKGTGELEGVDYMEINYEGYGPGGVAIIVEALTDNKNRTAASVRASFTKYSGSLGEAGSVSWIFERKGVIVFSNESTTEEQLMDIALEAGADDIQEDDSSFTVLTDPSVFDDVKKAIDNNNLTYLNAEITMHPKNMVKVTDESTASALLRLYDRLEDDDDVQNVYANFDIPNEIMEKLLDQ